MSEIGINIGAACILVIVIILFLLVIRSQRKSDSKYELPDYQHTPEPPNPMDFRSLGSKSSRCEMVGPNDTKKIPVDQQRWIYNEMLEFGTYCIKMYKSKGFNTAKHKTLTDWLYHKSLLKKQT